MPPASDEKNPPADLVLIREEMEALRQENQKLSRRLSIAEKDSAEAKAASLRDPNAQIAPIKVELKEADVRRTIESCPCTTSYYVLREKPWESKRQLGSFGSPIVEAKLVRHENGAVKDEFKGLTADFRPPQHQIGCDSLKFTVLWYDVAGVPLDRVRIRKEHIDKSNACRKQFEKTGILAPNALVLPIGIQEPRDRRGMCELEEAIEGMERLRARMSLKRVDGFPELMDESEFFAWALKTYAIRWAGLRMAKLAERAVKDPKNYDPKSGLGLLKVIDEQMQAVGA